MVARDSDGYLVIRVQPKPTHAVRAPTEPGLMETVAAFAEDTAATRLPSGLPPLRFGAGPGIDQAEIWGIIKTQDLRTAAGGGGGWGRPPQFRSLTGDSPEKGRLSGSFIDVEEGGKTTVAYGRTEGDQLVIVHSVAKDPIRLRETLGAPVDWGKAEIKHLDAVKTGSETQLSYEISIPIKAVKVQQASLVVRVVGYFKRLLQPNDLRTVDASVRAAVDRSASQNSVAGDGIVELKAEILRNVKPDRLEFHVNYGLGDVILVDEREAVGDDDLG
jgi:hypothetical protein